MRWAFDDDPENIQMIELEFSERDGRTTVVMVNSGISTDERRGAQHVVAAHAPEHSTRERPRRGTAAAHLP